ncbi:Abi family protein [Piscirickettsia salmonis]|uniref:Abi family protein n=1 Tax=Piscirickettsia salmonis TaxID=1238 RepID=UPI0006C73FBC|nr:Abi family protein [Piscirickettsia salmonis]APS44712.1 hypothetical protein AVI48_10290 [Piscirickettsia salmonis]APS48072.1 hypothetical protein AVI49_10895 [Piscirickettsia salmonis]
MKASFNKPPLSFEKQLQLLESRGMVIPDKDRALHYLENLNYYRLAAYWIPFQKDRVSHTFYEGTSFDDVLNLYIFDRELRLIVLDAIERVEVSVRTQLCYCLAHEHGSHAHLQPEAFFNTNKYNVLISKLKDEYRRSNESFVNHYREAYTETLPPIWVSVELFTFGQLSMCYQNIKGRHLKQKTASHYNIDEKLLGSFLHQLSFIRNLCAHHSRLWNRDLTVTMKIPRKKAPKDLLISVDLNENARKIYNTLTMMLYFMNKVNPNHHWKDRFFSIVNNHNIDLNKMGFKKEYQQGLWI